MARVEGDFNSDIIRTYKGTLDFYYWRGIPVVRSWPRKPLLPRAPAVAAAGQDWRDNSRALSTLPLSLQVATADEVKDTAYTWKDAWTTTIYGHGISWSLREQGGNLIPENELSMQVHFDNTGTDAAEVLNINSTNYKSYWTYTFLAPFSAVPYNRYRILLAGASNQAGQNVLADLGIDAVTPVPLHVPGPALTISNVYDRRDSGWITIDNIPATDQVLALIVKGSNATVDINWQMASILLAKF